MIDRIREASNAAYEKAAKLLETRAAALVRTGKRTNKIDRHTAEVLCRAAESIRWLKEQS